MYTLSPLPPSSSPHSHLTLRTLSLHHIITLILTFPTLHSFSLPFSQSKQKGEQPPDAARASEEIENVLLRKKVFDLLASTATVTWIDAPAATAE